MQTTDWSDFAAALRHHLHFDLFTVLDVDRSAQLVRRSYSSDEVHYPCRGVKRLLDSSWAAQVIDAGRPFASQDEREFRGAFADHDVLEALGLHFALNVPRRHGDTVCQTINLLRSAPAFSAAERQAVEAAVAALPEISSATLLTHKLYI